MEVIRRAVVDQIAITRHEYLKDFPDAQVAQVPSMEELRGYVAVALTRLELERLRDALANKSGLGAAAVKLKPKIWKNAVRWRIDLPDDRHHPGSPGDRWLSRDGSRHGRLSTPGCDRRSSAFPRSRYETSHHRTAMGLRSEGTAFRSGLASRDNFPERCRVLDPNGHGTHVAGIIAGYCEQPLPLDDGKERFRFSGMAPKAIIHSYRVLNENGEGNDSAIIKKRFDHIAETNERAGKLAIQAVFLAGRTVRRHDVRLWAIAFVPRTT